MIPISTVSSNHRELMANKGAEVEVAKVEVAKVEVFEVFQGKVKNKMEDKVEVEGNHRGCRSEYFPSRVD